MRLNSRFILTYSCLDRAGVTAAIANAIAGSDANIVEAHQHRDPDSGVLFARMDIELDHTSGRSIQSSLAEAADKYSISVNLSDAQRKKRVLILVSRFDHCLADLLYRWRGGELDVDVVGIISNYPLSTFRHLDLEGVKFDYLPVTPSTKPDQEAEIWKIVCDRAPDIVVLARYMQILSSELTLRLAGRCINIHHSFLPGFKGAKPYHQAYERGVKLIGATAHFVTEDLDEGPIIEQDVERVAHNDTAEALIRKGRDIERRVLARAVRWHMQDRVMLCGKRTVIFKD